MDFFRHLSRRCQSTEAGPTCYTQQSPSAEQYEVTTPAANEPNSTTTAWYVSSRHCAGMPRPVAVEPYTLVLDYESQPEHSGMSQAVQLWTMYPDLTYPWKQSDLLAGYRHFYF